MMRNVLIGVVAALAVTLGATVVRAEIDGHGPDAWRVTGVASDDMLNMRMGPGTQYLVIDRLAPDARGLKQITCVPLLIPSIYHRLTEAQRANLPQRWCLMQTADFAKAGWVAQRFIMEDTGGTGVQPGGGSAVVPEARSIGDPQIDGAARLVRDLYVAEAASTGRADYPFTRANAARYFFVGMTPELAGHGADLLYDAQDFQGRIIRIAPDPDQPMLRGMITVNVDFTNFGRPDRAVFRLRPDPQQPSAPVRIFRIEHDQWSFPQ
ncbi:hypothetical protein K1T73_15520 [Roseovarius sp. SCSIO 43702]|uniref:hypothetical protein n=1 Tax=Roseovarius sp. SCSIO 43702 TaxID=2823043 RepID=UPI001C7366F8|nr:hypothetical protein [Roseovarius sp. SCSIO 43702]QYX56443.1 hypothetical protein K1T73_15520 [Roseovarius sp. SCSIO 43702]